MVKILVAVLTFFSCSASYHFVNLEGVAITSVQPGVPFYIVLEVTGNCDSGAFTKIAELFQGARILDRKTQQSIITRNGTTVYKTKLMWQAIADQVGHILCPAATIGDQSIERKELEVAVTGPRKQEHLELEVALQEAYEGQAVPLKLQLVHERHAYDISLHVAACLEKNCIFFPEKSSTVMYEGKAKTTWHGFYYPPAKTTEEVVLPAFSATYKLDERTSSPFAFFSRSTTANHTYFSNAHSICVKKLPCEREMLNGIGQFTDFKAEVNCQKVQNGAYKLLLTLNGQEGALRRAHVPVPESPEFTCYQGAVTYKNDSAEFEYILTAQNSGTFVIPSLIFTYYDPLEKKVKRLATAVQEITSSTEPLQQSPLYILPEEELTREVTEKILVFPDYSSWLYRLSLPWYVVVWCVLVSCFFALLRLIFDTRRGKRIRRRIFLWIYARSLAIKLYLGNHTSSELYHLIRNFLLSVTDAPAGITDNELVKIVAEQEGVPYAQQWFEIVCALCHARYQEKPTTNVQSQGHIRILLNRFPLRILTVVALLFTLPSTAMGPAQQIAKLREQERFCSAYGLSWAEEQIAQIYRSSNRLYSPSLSQKVCGYISHAIPLVLAQLLCIISAWLLAIVGRDGLRFRLLWGLLFLLSSSITAMHWFERNERRGVVDEECALYAGPEERYPKLSMLQSLHEVVIDDEHQDWYHCISPMGRGWLKKEQLVIIESSL